MGVFSTRGENREHGTSGGYRESGYARRDIVEQERMINKQIRRDNEKKVIRAKRDKDQ